MSDPFQDNVAILLHMDGANNGTVFTDSSNYAHAFSRIFSPVTVTSPVDFGTASGSFGPVSGATVGLIKTPNTADLCFNSHGDFTVEGFVYLPSTAVNNSGTVLNIEGPNSRSPVRILYTCGPTFTGFNASGVDSAGNPVYTLASPQTSALNAWNHVALVNLAGTYTLYVNGTSAASASNASALNTSLGTINGAFGVQACQCTLGGIYSSNGTYAEAYIDEVRITNYLARYTSNFTPPSAPFDNPVPATCDQYFSNTSLQLHMNNIGSPSTYLDSSLVPNTITSFVGVQQASTVKWGASAGSFPSIDLNNPDKLSTPVALNGVMDLHLGDFTIESWFYVSALGGNDTTGHTYVRQYIYQNTGAHQNTSNPNSIGTALYVDSAANLNLFLQNNPDGGFNTTATHQTLVTTGVWHHAAVVKSGSNYDIYLDGIKNTAGITYATALGASDGTGLFFVGEPGQYHSIRGFYDDFRVTKGVARYTSNFLVPYQQFLDSQCQPVLSGGTVYGKLAAAPAYPPVFMGATLGSAKPRVWQEHENLNVKVPK